MHNVILQGEALQVLKTLPDNHVQTVVTSPPYYGLRSYLPDGHPDKQLEIGLEDTPEAYIARLVEVFREVKRVLRDDGTLWINCGDTYSSQPAGNKTPSGFSQTRPSRISGNGDQETVKLPKRNTGLKPKDLIGIPWMLAFALRADGWWLRSDIIWAKSNCMPESVEDRPTKAHEYIFLLSKSANYYYDSQAITEPAVRPGDIGTWGGEKGRNLTILPGDPNYRNGSEQWGRTFKTGNTRNKRSVWTVSTSPYSEAHFATFPPKLIEPCILAGSSPRACEHCGAPWERVRENTGEQWTTQWGSNQNMAKHEATKHLGRGYAKEKMMIHIWETTGWQPTCSHTNDGSAQCIVLDPFAGAGTVPLVSIQHHRQYIGIELNPEYVKLINDRIAVVQPDLWDTAEVLSIVRERVAEATPEEADELLDKLDALIEEKGGVA